jgi:hypothetical protein
MQLDTQFATGADDLGTVARRHVSEICLRVAEIALGAVGARDHRLLFCA